MIFHNQFLTHNEAPEFRSEANQLAPIFLFIRLKYKENAHALPFITPNIKPNYSNQFHQKIKFLL